MRLTTWNVNGIRNPMAYQPWSRHRTYQHMFDILQADIVVMQELKIQRKDLTAAMVLVPGWNVYLSLPREKKGYSGVAIYTRNSACAPIRAEEGLTGVLRPPRATTIYREQRLGKQIGGYPEPGQLTCGVADDVIDSEGRCILLEFSAFVLIGVYCPARRDDDESREVFRHAFLQALDVRVRNLIRDGKEVIVAGDLNVIGSTLDSNIVQQKVGQSHDDWLSQPTRRLFNHLIHGGEVIGQRDPGREVPVLWDLCRYFHPERQGMNTVWDQKTNARPANLGSRVDYIFCSDGIKSFFTSADIQPELKGSDHCPVFATTANVVRNRGLDVHLVDMMHPPGCFSRGQRVREQTELLALSAQLIAEFKGRQDISRMFPKSTPSDAPRSSVSDDPFGPSAAAASKSSVSDDASEPSTPDAASRSSVSDDASTSSMPLFGVRGMVSPVEKLDDISGSRNATTSGADDDGAYTTPFGRPSKRAATMISTMDASRSSQRTPTSRTKLQETPSAAAAREAKLTQFFMAQDNARQVKRTKCDASVSTVSSSVANNHVRDQPSRKSRPEVIHAQSKHANLSGSCKENVRESKVTDFFPASGENATRRMSQNSTMGPPTANFIEHGQAYSFTAPQGKGKEPMYSYFGAEVQEQGTPAFNCRDPYQISFAGAEEPRRHSESSAHIARDPYRARMAYDSRIAVHPPDPHHHDVAQGACFWPKDEIGAGSSYRANDSLRMAKPGVDAIPCPFPIHLDEAGKPIPTVSSQRRGTQCKHRPDADVSSSNKVYDPIEVKEMWSNILGNRVKPLCEHNEPCITFVTKKKGINQGRSFYTCPRPLGPSGQGEVGTDWRCRTFIWSSDWTGQTKQV